jgi:hypothetical protein
MKGSHFMDSYIKSASLDIKDFCERIAKNEDLKNFENDEMVNQEQLQLIKNIELKLKAMKNRIKE